MEATEQSIGLLDKILPPRLEDAGLEDCALPPESIHEAFRKAASAVNSCAFPFFEEKEKDGCIVGPCPAEKKTDDVVGPDTTPLPEASDTIVFGGAVPGDNGSCVGGDLSEKEGDVVVVGGVDEGKSCGDGLKGLGVEGMNDQKKNEEEEEEEEEEKPILVEGFV